MPLSPHPSRLSISSNLSDDLQVYAPTDLAYNYGPQENPFSDTGGSPRNSYNGPTRTGSTSMAGGRQRSSQGGHGRTDSQSSNTTGKRSRARAFSFLLESASPEVSHLSPNLNMRSPNPNEPFTRRGSEVPFGSPDYNDALAPEETEGEDEDEDGIELRSIGKIEGGSGAYRQTFQALTQQELWWMGASALSVLGLATGAVVIVVLS